MAVMAVPEDTSSGLPADWPGASSGRGPGLSGRAPGSSGPRPWTSRGSGSACDGVRTRFAPAPTGFLHLGHVVNALYVWGVARALGGEVRLRIEDHDGSVARRCSRRRCLRTWSGWDSCPTRPPVECGPAPARAGSATVTPCIGRRGAAGVRRAGLRLRVHAAPLEAAQPLRDAAGAEASARSGAIDCRRRGLGLPLDEGQGWRVRLDPGARRSMTACSARNRRILRRSAVICWCGTGWGTGPISSR